MKQFPAHIVAVFGIVENDNNEVLLLKHRDKDVWMFPGGQVEIGENLIDALKRETKEEANMEIEVNKLFCVTSNTCTYQGYNGYGLIPTKVIFGFTCSFLNGIYQDSDETTGHKWVLKSDVLSLLTVPDLIDKYKVYLSFSGEVKYLEYITRPEYNLKLERFV